MSDHGERPGVIEYLQVLKLAAEETVGKVEPLLRMHLARSGKWRATEVRDQVSSLSIWWIELGIAVEFTGPAAPQDNGSHERMHRDLKAEAITPPSANHAAQQRRFERWQHTYNYDRPHESLDQQRPCEFYRRRIRPEILPASKLIQLGYG